MAEQWSLLSDSSKVEALREQFDTAFTEEDLSSIPYTGNCPFGSIFIVHVFVQGAKKQLEKFALTKTGGLDLIPARVLEETSFEMTDFSYITSL